MLKITNCNPLCPTFTIDTNDVQIGHGVMTELGIDAESYKIEVLRLRIDDLLPPTKARSVRINEISEFTEQIKVQFLDDNKVVGIDWFSQRDCVALFRLIYGWVNLGLTHLKLKEAMTRRILQR
jgi:hypothetical protein